jgi:hypothetical protein
MSDAKLEDEGEDRFRVSSGDAELRVDGNWLMQFLNRDSGVAPEPGDELPEGYVRSR